MKRSINLGKVSMKSVLIKMFFVSSFSLLIYSCKKDDNSNSAINSITPKGAKPAWGPDITPQMQTVIEKLASFGTPPLYTLTAQQARLAPSAADAAMAVAKDYNIATPTPMVDTTGKDIPVTGGTIHVRIYTPKTGKSIYPLIMYYHGGGFVIATIDTYNSSAQALAEQVEAVVVSVEYRKGPEFKFPTAHNDSYAAYLWALNNAASIKVDTMHVALAGESAGGNLVPNVSRMAKTNNRKVPLHQVLIYPVANNDTTDASYVKYAAAMPLNKPLLLWFFNNYLNTPTESADPRLSLVNSNLTGMPPTTIIAAELDPLQTEGKLLADKLTAAGVAVSYQLFSGVTHEFYGMNLVIPEAQQAEAFAASQIKNAFK